MLLVKPFTYRKINDVLHAYTCLSTASSLSVIGSASADQQLGVQSAKQYCSIMSGLHGFTPLKLHEIKPSTVHGLKALKLHGLNTSEAA